ncbi:hypothetical protein OIE69_40685 [Actinacidiphila glaucinigra]|uniref:hypothetical protein n=1 Tax=Actinacidiphila glaucinigra TaxID=235986 RepID=UPI002DDA95AB|nr:hypothetical protein [Actinacidiphila glaucinigra]WSD64769.1 hypothetical protein OIE69_40685 [Actinacidiphila glaucinigra]
MLPFDVMDAEVTTAGQERSGLEFMSRQENRPVRVRRVRRRQGRGSAGTPQAAADTRPVAGRAVLIRSARTSRTASMAMVRPRITNAAPSSVVRTPIAALSGPTVAWASGMATKEPSAS